MEKEEQWEVYIIQVESGQLYTGITNDLTRRFSEHLQGKKGARFFSFFKTRAHSLSRVALQSF